MAKPKDQSISFGQGQYHGVRPYVIPEGYTEKNINLTTVGDRLSIRDRFIEVPVKVVNDKSIDKTTYQDNLERGKYQGDCPYFYDDTEYFIIVISGLIYQIEVATGYAYVINEEDRLNQYSNRIICSNFGKYVQVFDYPDRPLIIEGSNVFRTSEIEAGTPASKNGIFNYNRGFVTNEFNEWLASDPVGGESPDAPLSFVETTNPQSPFFGAFDLGFKNRNTKINYLGSLPTNDSGIGALIISNGESIFSYTVNQPRSIINPDGSLSDGWRSSVFGGELVSNVGVAGERAGVNYRRDLFFLSSTGYISTIKFARAQEQGSYTVRTLSGRSQNWLDTRFKDLYKYAVLEVFEERLFTTCKPYRTTAIDTFGNIIEDFAHAGLLVHEFQTKQGEEDQRPVDAGMWTGIYPMAMREVGGNFFILSKDVGRNRLYRLDKNADYDVIKGQNKQVGYRFYTKGYVFGDIDSRKDLYNHSYEVCVSGNWKENYYLLKNECDNPIKIQCETNLELSNCVESCRNPLKGKYIDSYSPGVEFSNKDVCSKYFKSAQLIITGEAKNYNLFRIDVEANKSPDDERLTNIKDQVIEDRNCDFIHDLNVYSLPLRGLEIK